MVVLPCLLSHVFCVPPDTPCTRLCGPRDCLHCNERKEVNGVVGEQSIPSSGAWAYPLSTIGSGDEHASQSLIALPSFGRGPRAGMTSLYRRAL